MILLKMEEIGHLSDYGSGSSSDLLVHNGAARHYRKGRGDLEDEKELLRNGFGWTLSRWYPEICEHVRKNYPEELL